MTFKISASISSLLKPFGASLISAFLIFLSFPNNDYFYFAWIAFIPLLLSIRATGVRGSFLLGFSTGFFTNAAALYWIYTMIQFNTGSRLQAMLCLVAMSAYLALYYGIWTALLRFVMPSLSLLRFSLFAACLWVSLEYLRAHFLTGFPWLLLGMSQWRYTSIIQISEFTGVYGVSFLIMLVNVSFTRFAMTRKIASFFLVMAGLACVSALCYVVKLRNEVTSPPYMSVAVLQGNIDQYKKWDNTYQDEIMRVYSGLAREASLHNPDLIVWPETAVPGFLPTNMFLYDWVRGTAKETKTYNLIGSPYNDGDSDYFNAVLLFGPEGEMLGVHKKTHLVPFGEFVPFRKLLAPYFAILNTLGDFTRGKLYDVFPVKSIRCASTICSENFFGGTVRHFVLNGAEVILNQTNDAWFFKTAAAKQHFIMNVFRAIENRRTIIVSGNTGISGIVSPGGVISHETPLFERTFFLAKISPSRYLTFYTRHGDLFAQCCVLMSLLMLVAINRKIFTAK